MKNLFQVLWVLACLNCAAQESVQFDADVDGAVRKVQAVFTQPKVPASGKWPAVVLMHSSGGEGDGTTGPLAKALNASGMASLEIKLFSVPMSGPPFEHVNAVYFNALKYLNARGDVDGSKVGIAGYSYGAFGSLFTASEWVAQRYGGGLKFAAHAPIYLGSCWMFTHWARGEAAPNGRSLPYPKDFATRWTGAPIKIFAAGKDDYDDRDPNACSEFVATVPAEFRTSFDLIVYPEATHGWNQQSRSFYVKGACKGKGCVNHNVNNPAVSAKNNDEVVQFFLAKLGSNTTPGQACPSNSPCAAK